MAVSRGIKRSIDERRSTRLSTKRCDHKRLFRAGTKPVMAWDFGRSAGPLVLIVIIASVVLTTVMSPSTVFMMVLPSMILFSVVAFLLGMKHGEFRTA